MEKRIKDPIYGYVEIPEQFTSKIVDTPEFQRLRGIVQTSYAAVYPSTLHNRFVHSIGVYHLGRIASKGIEKNTEKKDYSSCVKNCFSIFELACLLHDVGHAPFSHTGEDYYLVGNDRSSLHKEILEKTGDDDLQEEIKKYGYKAAPHELMSALISLEKFESFIPESERGFFARCIIGYKYRKSNTDDSRVKNCFIELLNSKVLDVDKADYLIRDAYMSGFDTAAIDYQRLFGNISIEKEKDDYILIYPKSALSVVENVVFAHDLEKKWLQSHPAVLYDSFLIKKVYERIIEEFFPKERCFPKEVLTLEGRPLEKLGRIRLASDSDIIYMMKNFSESKISDEYYDRSKRKHPLWKTEAEFHAIFDTQEKLLEELDLLIGELNKNQKRGYIQIDNEALEAIEKDISDTEEMLTKAKDENEKRRYTISLSSKERQKNFINIFHSFSNREGILFDFLLIYADQFNSSFKKNEFGDMNFGFATVEKPCKFRDVSNVLKQEDSVAEKFFYIFCHKNDKGQRPSFSVFVKDLLEFAGKIWSEKNALQISGKISK